jgi:hypothetical protein
MDGSLYKYTGMAHFMVKGYLSKLDICLRDEDYRPRIDCKAKPVELHFR